MGVVVSREPKQTAYYYYQCISIMSCNNELAVREQIAMYVTALPVPPLPVDVSITTADGTEERGFTSSHDLIAGLLLMAMHRNRTDLNAIRLQTQKRLIDALLEDLERHAAAADDAAIVYGLYVRFTGHFIQAFHDPNQPSPQVHFARLDDDREAMRRDGKLHASCAHWMAAQDILHVPDAASRRTAAQFQRHMSYVELLQEQLRRSCPKNDYVPTPLPPPSVVPTAPAPAPAPNCAEAAA